MMGTLIDVAHAALHSPAGMGAISGFLAAARVDYVSFKQWRSWSDLTHYSWGTATFRWVQGAIIGLVSAWTVSAAL